MTAGSTIGSTNISLNKITSTQEYEGLLTQNTNSSLTTNSTRLLATKPWSGSTNVVLDNSTPHAMSEFIGYKAPLNSSDYTVAEQAPAIPLPPRSSVAGWQRRIESKRKCCD